MIRPPWRGGAVSLPRATQDKITPKIGSENRHYEPKATPLAHLHQTTTSWGYTINTRDDYMIPKAYVNNPHFPAASGHTETLGAGSCNFKGVQGDRISKKTWEENVSREGFLRSKARILKLLEADRAALKAYLRG
jgi:hypothetical protein